MMFKTKKSWMFSPIHVSHEYRVPSMGVQTVGGQRMDFNTVEQIARGSESAL